MRRSGLVVPWALAVTFALVSCTRGQSGHEGGGLDGPADMLDGGDVGGSGGPGNDGGAGAGGFGNDGAGSGAGTGGCVPGTVGGTRTADADGDGGLAPTDEAAGDCPPDDDDDDGGVYVPPPRDPTPLNSEHVCASSLIEAPIDCFDVCGALTTCDAAIACDDCLERCAASRQATRHGVRCLSLAIYWIDEDGCERMVSEYHAFTDAFDCGE